MTYVVTSKRAVMLAQRKQEEREARDRIKLWVQPRTTLSYFLRELFCLLFDAWKGVLRQRRVLITGAVILASLWIVVQSNGPHQKFINPLWKDLLWSLYWLGLGVLSSVGLGSGLHTFVLYLGPHIAKVTLAAYECDSLAFPEPPYPDEVICPDEANGGVSLWTIMGKVRWEAIMWGAGTALGELPPYFIARAARGSGNDEDCDEIQDVEEQRGQKPKDKFLTKLSKWIERLVANYGFFAILLFASVPNPIFDLAGMTCGHFLIPFWTFFGATFIGKSLIKMHIQQLFVITACNDVLLETFLNFTSKLPIIGQRLQQPLRDFLTREKEKLHKRTVDGQNVVGWLLEKFSFVMIAIFAVSIINFLAQNHHKRINESGKYSFIRGSSKDVKAS